MFLTIETFCTYHITITKFTRQIFVYNTFCNHKQLKDLSLLIKVNLLVYRNETQEVMTTQNKFLEINTTFEELL